MDIGRTVEAADRAAWRRWLAAHHAREREIWLVFHNKSAGRAGVAYGDAVEEALCFGWIDGQVKKRHPASCAQRFTPRRPGANWSELNKARARKLIAAQLMTDVGLAALGDALERPFAFPEDLLAALRAEPQAWRNFGAFPEDYRRIRAGYVLGARGRPEEYAKRLANLVRMSAKNKMFGSMP